MQSLTTASFGHEIRNVLSHFSYTWCLSAEVQAIASLIEKQAQIVVKQKEVSEVEKRQKQALLQQYANVTDDEEYPFCVSVCLETSFISKLYSEFLYLRLSWDHS